MLGLAHVVVGLAHGEVDVLPRLLERERRLVARGLRLVDGGPRHAAVEEVPARGDAGVPAVAVAALRLEVLAEPRARGETDRRAQPRLRLLDRELLLLERIAVREEVLAAAQRVADAVGEADVEGVVDEIVRERQRLAAVDVQEVAQRREIHLVAVLRLDERLARVGELDRGAQHVDARLGARLVELLDVREVRLVVVGALLVDRDGLARLERVEIRLDDAVLELLSRALRRERGDVRAERGRVDARLVPSARVERQRAV